MLDDEPELPKEMAKKRGVDYILKSAVGKLRDIPTKVSKQSQPTPVNDAPVASKPRKGNFH